MAKKKVKKELKPFDVYFHFGDLFVAEVKAVDERDAKRRLLSNTPSYTYKLTKSLGTTIVRVEKK